jgi:hypothetical protein
MDEFFWITAGDPGSWRIVGSHIAYSWYEYDGPMSRFLADVFKRRVQCKLFPKDVPSANVRITQYGTGLLLDEPLLRAPKGTIKKGGCYRPPGAQEV